MVFNFKTWFLLLPLNPSFSLSAPEEVPLIPFCSSPGRFLRQLRSWLQRGRAGRKREPLWGGRLLPPAALWPHRCCRSCKLGWEDNTAPPSPAPSHSSLSPIWLPFRWNILLLPGLELLLCKSKKKKKRVTARLNLTFDFVVAVKSLD